MAVNLTHTSGDLPENSEINVTPFIDVMLVLLIIFMVAAPLSTVDAPVNLPASTAKPGPRPEKPVFVTLKEDRTILVNDDRVEIDSLGRLINKFTGNKRDKRVFLRADKNVSYGQIVEIMNALRASGYLRLGFVGLEAAPRAGQ